MFATAAAVLIFSSLVHDSSSLEFKKGHPYKPSSPTRLLQLRNIKGNIYSDTFSTLENVEELRIISSDVQAIEDNALCPSGTVRKLTIIRNYLFPNLTKKTFGDCKTLIKLTIWGNEDVFIEPGTFSGLTNLRYLEIASKSISGLNKVFFAGLYKLETLHVADEIKSVEASTFQDLKNLKDLSLDNSESSVLLKIPKDLFARLKSLRRLTLRGIDLGNWDTLRSLNPALEELDLQENNLKRIDVEIIARQLPNLKFIAIKNNPIKCQLLQLIGEELLRKIKGVVVDALSECYDERNDSLIIDDF